MSVTIEQDLKELLGEINRKLDKIDGRFTNLEISQARLEEKVDGLGKRMENQEFVSRGVLAGLIIEIIRSKTLLFEAKRFWSGA